MYKRLKQQKIGMSQLDQSLDRWNNKLNSLVYRVPKMNQSVYVFVLYGSMLLIIMNLDKF